MSEVVAIEKSWLELIRSFATKEPGASSTLRSRVIKRLIAMGYIVKN